MAYSWTMSIGKQDDAIALLKQGMQANPVSYLLTFAYAEIEEQLKNLEEVHTAYNTFIDALHAELEEMDATQRQLVASASVNSIQAAPADQTAFDPNAPPPGLSISTPTGGAASASTTSSQASQHELTMADRRQELGIVWIQYMRFARRAEGLKPARTVFSKARKDKKWVTWEVFEAAGAYLSLLSLPLSFSCASIALRTAPSFTPLCIAPFPSSRSCRVFPTPRARRRQTVAPPCVPLFHSSQTRGSQPATHSPSFTSFFACVPRTEAVIFSHSNFSFSLHARCNSRMIFLF